MNLNKKSRLASLLLTILLVPLGLMYSSVVGGLVLTLIALVTLPTVVGPIVCWLLAIVAGDSNTYKHNRSIERFEDLMLSKRNLQ